MKSWLLYAVLCVLPVAVVVEIIFYAMNRRRQKHGKTKLSQWLASPVIIVVVAFLSIVGCRVL